MTPTDVEGPSRRRDTPGYVVVVVDADGALSVVVSSRGTPWVDLGKALSAIKELQAQAPVTTSHSLLPATRF